MVIDILKQLSNDYYYYHKPCCYYKCFLYNHDVIMNVFYIIIIRLQLDVYALFSLVRAP